MKNISKIIYYIKVFLFIINFYFIFAMLHNILDTKIFGLIFIIIYLVYVIKIILEMLSKKDRYKQDFIYNFMQIGLIIYIMVISIRCMIVKMYVTRFSLPYFRINYIILSILIIFILIYNFVGFSEPKKTKKKRD